MHNRSHGNFGSIQFFNGNRVNSPIESASTKSNCTVRGRHYLYKCKKTKNITINFEIGEI